MKRFIFFSLLLAPLFVYAASERWSAERAQTWYDAQPWLVGANFVPSTAINQLEMWQAETFDPETIDRELGWAASIGMNTMRVFLHDLVYMQDPEAFLERIDEYLAIAERHGIRTLFVVFDGVWDPEPKLGSQPEPVPGVHNSGWVQSPGKAILGDAERIRKLEPYVKDVIKRFAADDRVLGWDLFNEPDNMVVNSYGTNGTNTELPREVKHEAIQELLRLSFQWAREVDPSQPLTVGIWGAFDVTNLKPWERISMEQSDVLSFHTYQPAAEVEKQVAQLVNLGRPLLCTEYMARGRDSTFEDVLPIFRHHRIGAYNWGFVNGRSQTIYPWDSWDEAYETEPNPWFHDIFRKNGEPYRSEETTFIRKIIEATNRPGGQLPTTPETASAIESTVDAIEHPLPIVEPLFDYHVRDISIAKGPNGRYYLTGTTDDNWGVAEGIRVWESADLEQWTLLGDDGFVWTFEKDGHPWQKEPRIHENTGRIYRGIWAPEIHYLKGTFWIPYSSSNVHDSGLLRSVSGRAEGPYVDIKVEGPLVEGIDATLVEDQDGSIYYIWAHGRVRRMNEDMSGFTDKEYPDLYDAEGKMVGYEGVNMFRRGDRYYLLAAEWNAEGPERGHKYRNTNRNRRIADARYDCMVAESPSLLGPYSESYIGAPHAGHNMIFEDFDGRLWATMFGNDDAASPFRENPAIVPITINAEGHIEPALPHAFAATPEAAVLYVSPRGSGRDGNSWDTAFTSLQDAIDAAKENSQIWIAVGIYPGPFRIENKTALYLYGGFGGYEESLDERNAVHRTSVLQGSGDAHHVLAVENSTYVRLDGLVITGGRAQGDGSQRHGGGLFVRGGGETLRVLNTVFRGNRAARNGGGIYATDGASPLFINCSFVDNEAAWRGGAAAFEATESNGYHARFYNCHLGDNRALVHGGAVYYRTELKQTGLLRLMNCTVTDNFTLLEKGNITLEGGANLLVSNSLFARNKGMSNGDVVITFGDVPGSARIVNSVFVGNEGGYLMSSEAFGPKWVELLHNVFHDNRVQALMLRPADRKMWQTTEELDGVAESSGNREVDPRIIPRKVRYEVANDSPLIDAGTPQSTFPMDRVGRPRNTADTSDRSPVDIGPLEF